MKTTFLLTIFFSLFFLTIQAQDNQLEGRVLEKLSKGTEQGLLAANIYWVNGSNLVSTDINGEFSIAKVDFTNQLVISHISYQNDTINIEQDGFVIIVLEDVINLETVDVTSRQKSSSISYLNTINTLNIGKKELTKAACCNLGESFETSPAVDVSFTDAVTGTRQIQLLGLAGPYTQITRENIPDIRGLSALYGLGHSPGTWIESIQLVKGAGSVQNGFESIAGQINVEIEKPEETDRFFANLYGNLMGRGEANVHFSHIFSEQIQTGILAHYSQNIKKNDGNDDGFIDNPLKRDLIFMNRWKLIGDDGFRGQFGVKYVNSTHFGGQIAYDGLKQENSSSVWGLDLNNERFEAWTKTGWVNESKSWQSVGLQIAAMSHNQVSLFGNTNYDAEQQMFYANLIYNGIIGTTDHKIKTGLSYQFDQYNEVLNFPGFGFERKESVPGIFGEYTYCQGEKMSLVLGLRGDYHNTYGFFVTPRMHFRYAPSTATLFRLSAGRGQRTANIFAENFALLASNRDWVLHSGDPDKPYGLDPEVAWNYGVSFSRDFKIDYREGAVTFDFFRTDFQNQIVVDIDQSPQEVNIYNLDGISSSNSLQVQVDYELIKRLDMRLAYRWFEVKTEYQSGVILDKPLLSKHRAFINLGYSTRDNWAFDYTLNWQGAKRIPSTLDNPVEFQLDEYSPSYILMNAQISKSWNEKFDVYIGVENLLNFRQTDAILDAENPFGEYFDASYIWGPVFGRNVYAGVKYRIFK